MNLLKRNYKVNCRYENVDHIKDQSVQVTLIVKVLFAEVHATSPCVEIVGMQTKSIVEKCKDIPIIIPLSQRSMSLDSPNACNKIKAHISLVPIT